MELKILRIVLISGLIYVSLNESVIAFTPLSSPGRFRSYKSLFRLESSTSNEWETNLADSALRNVQNLAASVTRANDNDPAYNREDDPENIRGTGDTKSLYSYLKYQPSSKGQNRQNVVNALQCLERDMQLLDNITAEKPQLSRLELSLLFSSVAAACASPLFPDGLKVAEVLAPAAAALNAAVGIGAEYTGKVAVADGKEVAAATLQCAAEAEGFLARAERVKAITPLCVGISATAATVSLVTPVVLDSLSPSLVATELYLLSPLVAVLGASVASLSLQETRSYASRAISVGNRRFAKGGLVGRTWLSASEQIEQYSQRTTDRWKSFALSVLPAPFIGTIVPGPLSTKAVIVAALAAAQCAFFLAQAESILSRGTDAVALKSRSAAVCDTYANQGARSAAILPFTSALSSLCAAATAAIVELPWLEALAGIGGPQGSLASVALVGLFPALGSIFAAAASVSKARCEVDAEAAIQAAATLALEYDDEDDPILRPIKGVVDLIRVTITTTWKSFKKTRFVTTVQPIFLRLKRIFRPKQDKSSAQPDPQR